VGGDCDNRRRSAGVGYPRSLDGAVSLSGELGEFDGSTYVLKSVIGDIRIDVNDVECIGKGCPE
jgi:hypothetical protein